MYANGDGVPQDYGLAATWYRKAAEQGLPTAQVPLASAYYLGQGVPQDYVLAYMWANLSAASSSGATRDSAVKLRDMVSRKLTPQQMAEAQRLAREWKPTPAK
jgi:TPR repeat protein